MTIQKDLQIQIINLLPDDGVESCGMLIQLCANVVISSNANLDKFILALRHTHALYKKMDEDVNDE